MPCHQQFFCAVVFLLGIPFLDVLYLTVCQPCSSFFCLLAFHFHCPRLVITNQLLFAVMVDVFIELASESVLSWLPYVVDVVLMN